MKRTHKCAGTVNDEPTKATGILGILVGAHRHTLKELWDWPSSYPIQWRDPRVNLSELAKLRWIEGWDRKKLATHYGRTEMAVQNYFQEIRRKGFKLPGLTEEELRRVKANARSTR